MIHSNEELKTATERLARFQQQMIGSASCPRREAQLSSRLRNKILIFKIEGGKNWTLEEGRDRLRPAVLPP